MKKNYLFLFLVCLNIFAGNVLYAQITTASINGKIIDEKGVALPDCSVLAVNNSTGTKYVTITNVNGLYNIQNMNVGGPYTITISYVGYNSQKKENVFLNLGSSLQLDFNITESATAINEVTVTADKNKLKSGTNTNLTKEHLDVMPSINRSIQDFTKMDPRNTNNSFGGSNFRYNNITLDGAINNDAIGFSPSLGGVSGTSNMPGSSTRSNPISLDAIQEIQTTVAPFDVRLGNFTGGSINAVTKSGTNDIKATVYAFGRNQKITGKVDDENSKPMTYNFYDYQTGASVGLPIIKDKLFFFTNIEVARKKEPLFYGAGQQGSVVSEQLAAKIDSFLNAKYHYSPGAYNNYTINTNSNKAFARFDWNITNKTSLAIRTNYITSDAGNLERSQSIFKFGSQDFIQHNNQSSTVAEFKTRTDLNLSNSLIVGYSNIHDYRSLANGASVFPAVQINNVGNGANNLGSGQIFLGTDREAAIFNMYQSTVEISDNLSYFWDKHNFTVGTHNELYNIKYGFINSWNGRIEYNNVNDFFADKPSRIRGTYNNGTVGDNSYDYNYNNPSADFNIYLFSGYLQDEYSATKNFKITGGLRFDMPVLPNKPELSYKVTNTADDQNLGSTYNHTSWSSFKNDILGKVTASPRIGFNYDINNNQSFVLRGGSGIFTGRIPFAWLGYAYYNNGVNFNSVDYKNNGVNVINLSANPNAIYSQLPASNKSTTEVDLIDNNFKMPQVWRSSLATDMKLPGDINLTLEGLFTKTIYDVEFQNINLKDSVRYCTCGPTETPIYLSGGATGGKVNTQFSNAYLLTNTRQGYRYSLTAQLQKRFKFGLGLMLAYTYGESFDISNGIRNSPQSNWEVNPAINPNNPGLAYSNFDIRHRIIASINYKKDWNKKYTTYVSLFSSFQSGSPYTYVYNNNFTGDGQQNVQLAYIPKDQNDITLVTNGATDTRTTDQIWQELNSYISHDSYLNSRRGKYTERNGARTPWNNEVDLRIMQDIHFMVGSKMHTLQVSFDILNVANLLNKNWGQYYFVPNTMNSTVPFGLTQKGFDANKNPTFTYITPTSKPYSVDQLASRWQAQIGIRYSF